MAKWVICRHINRCLSVGCRRRLCFTWSLADAKVDDRTFGYLGACVHALPGDVTLCYTIIIFFGNITDLQSGTVDDINRIILGISTQIRHCDRFCLLALADCQRHLGS